MTTEVEPLPVPVGARIRDSVRLPSGTREPGVVFPLSRRRQWAAVALFLGLGVASFVLGATGALKLGPLQPLVPPVFAFVGTYLVILGVAVASRAFDEPMIALARSGVAIRWLGAETFITWQSIRDVTTRPSTSVFPGPGLTRLVLSPTAPVTRGGLSALLNGPGALSRSTVIVPIRGLPIGPDEFEALVRAYLSRPELRQTIGSGTASSRDIRER